MTSRWGAPPPGYRPGYGRGALPLSSGVSRDTREQPDREDTVSQFEEMGFGPFSSSFDKEDDEADKIYDDIETQLERRRKKTRTDVESSKASGSIASQFESYKRELSSVRTEEWSELPEAKEYLKVKKRSYERFTPTSTLTDLGEAKQKMLMSSLDELASDSLSNKPSYSEPTSVTYSPPAEVTKTRLLFRSLIRSDPGNMSGWVGAARLEESAGDTQAALAILTTAVVECAMEEELWVECMRMAKLANVSKEEISDISQRALAIHPTSVAVWIAAINSETSVTRKKIKSSKALATLPSPVPIRLWEEALRLEGWETESADADELRALLVRAVKDWPGEVRFWISLARFSGTSAQAVLNEARKKCPTSELIWLTAAELIEESQIAIDREPSLNDRFLTSLPANFVDSLVNLFSKSIDSLAKNGKSLTADEWISLATESELSGHRAVPHAIVRSVCQVSNQTKATLMSLSDKCLNTLTTRIALLECCADLYRRKKSPWIRMLEICRDDSHLQESILERAVTACPNKEMLWLMAAKKKFIVHDLKSAKLLLSQAAEHHPESIDILLALSKIAVHEEDWGEGRRLLEKARENGDERVWIKSVLLEWDCGELQKAIDLCTRGISEKTWKLQVMRMQLLVASGDIDTAVIIAKEGGGRWPVVWSVASEILLSSQGVSQARSFLERGRIKIPNSDLLWLKSVQLERNSAGNYDMASLLLGKGLSVCHNSPILWAEAILMEPHQSRHPKCLDALKRCPNSGEILSEIARFFWLEKRQIDKAAKWWKHSAELDPKNGQVWAGWLAFEIDIKSGKKQHVLKSFQDSEPNKGLLWNQIVKQPHLRNLPLIHKMHAFLQAVYPTQAQFFNS